MSQKLRVCRSSGMPVRLEHIDGFQADYKVAFDKILDKFHKDKTKFIDAKLSERMNRLLARVEKSLHRKYPNMDEWPFMSTPEEWTERVLKYGPIALARNRDTAELTYVILDTEF